MCKVSVQLVLFVSVFVFGSDCFVVLFVDLFLFTANNIEWKAANEGASNGPFEDLFC